MRETDRTEIDQIRRTTQTPYSAGLTERTAESLDLRGAVGRELRHRREMQPLVDWTSDEEWR